MQSCHDDKHILAPSTSSLDLMYFLAGPSPASTSAVMLLAQISWPPHPTPEPCWVRIGCVRACRAAPSCTDPSSNLSRQFAEIAAEACLICVVLAAKSPQGFLEQVNRHLTQPITCETETNWRQLKVCGTSVQVFP